MKGESISNVLFYGKEVNLMAFELLSFVLFDMAFTSYVVSAVITFCLSTIASGKILDFRNLSVRKFWFFGICIRFFGIWFIYKIGPVARVRLAKRNMSRKTLIDQRFLIWHQSSRCKLQKYCLSTASFTSFIIFLLTDSTFLWNCEISFFNFQNVGQRFKLELRFGNRAK